MKTLTRSSLISVLLMGVTLRNGQAQIVTDGSLGTSRMLTGPNYQIPSSLGQVYGPNLFQSFRQFNLSANQSATFSGPVSVVNILSRVTGGQQSHIDGTINSTIPGANLFFVNPSGVVLGPKGAIKVNGSFVVSTADLVRLKDGHVLQAGHPTDAILSSAPPEAFGFLNSSPAAIQINGSALAVNMGRSISLIGGDLQLQQAMLTARRGAINLVSVAAAGQVEWPINTRGSEVNLMTFSQMGNINAHNVIITVADPPPPGSEQIHGSQTNNWLLKSFGEVIKSEVVKGEVDKGVDKGNTGSRISNPAMDSYAADNTPETNPLQTNSLPGGSVVLRGNNLALINSVIFAGNTGTTRGGQIDVGVRGTLRLLQDSTINTRAVGQERGAAIKVVAGGVMLQDYSGLATSGESYGKGGDIIINTKNLVATNGSYIGALSTAQGASGDISITSDRVDLKGQGFSSNIGTATLGDGKGGNINLTGKMVNVSNTDVITTSTSGRGDGGSIFINSDQVTLNGQITPAKFTGTTVTGTPPRGTSPRGTPRTEAGDTTPPAIGVATMTLAPQGGGKGGNINLQSHTLDILNGGQVTATTRGSGTAGDIAVKTAATSLTGGGLIGVSTLASQGGGKSGNINLQSHTLDILNGGLVSADTVNNGNAGTITIDADKVLINGEGSRDFTAITATTLGTGRGGKGGNINLQSHTLDILNGGVLATDTKGSGSAGSIFIKADNIQ
ncbi:MAG: filamentous hemagglutinin N-terminal domain-containing protein, partial [Abitibacteriaceae bacterium]|nr:filamentous hemagglutinin N-terminal domain-containing protein [Abditibacteriaceae bacterium]